VKLHSLFWIMAFGGLLRSCASTCVVYVVPDQSSPRGVSDEVVRTGSGDRDIPGRNEFPFTFIEMEFTLTPVPSSFTCVEMVVEVETPVAPGAGFCPCR